MANLLTAIRLLLVLPVVLAIADADLFPRWLLPVMILVAIASDYFDGKVARARNTASSRGMLFDHGTDFIFVTSALFALSLSGLATIFLPSLIVVAFSQYVLDSYFLFKQKQLRMSYLGRWNGILYFVPLVLYSASRLDLLAAFEPQIGALISAICYALLLSTIASIVDRALSPLRSDRQY